MDILRFITAGNVDDGKSTLIGRLLYDTKNLKSDVLESVSEVRAESGERRAELRTEADQINLAHITDGLRSERAQGITIDVAYKYITTKSRKYIITDAPGHFQYTRNLVTGASGVDAIIILIDALNGITEQTRRHSLVASFLGIRQVVVAVNKMDLVGYSEEVFECIRRDFMVMAEQLRMHKVQFIPISALEGENVSFRSEKMSWYKGEPLEEYLEGCVPVELNTELMRFSVQYVIEGKGYAGKLLSGRLKVGDRVMMAPLAWSAKVERIFSGYDEVNEAGPGDNIVVYLSGGVGVERGSLLSHTEQWPQWGTEIEVMLCWLDSERPMCNGGEYLLRMNSFETTCVVKQIVYKTDVHTFGRVPADGEVVVNEFARVLLSTRDVVCYDSFDAVCETGRGILIDGNTNYTAGAFTVI